MCEREGERESEHEQEHESELEETTDDHPLAAVVTKPRSEVAIESLRTEGVYDDSRHVREYDEETVALPITDSPTETRVLEVIRQIDPELRAPSLEDRLAERGWNETDLESVPGSWAVIGSVILVSIPPECPDEHALGETLLECHPEAESVLADEGVGGESRKEKRNRVHSETDESTDEGNAGTHREPNTRLIAGSSETETIHTEHGTKYGLDPTKVMFSPGNQAERARLGDLVSPDERVFDMFAGIGYFTLPMARAGAHVTAAEINPTAFRYLLENVMLNDVSDRVDAYGTDCRELVEDVEADRVVMGYYGVSDADADGDTDRSRTNEAHEFLPHALEALVPGGVLHYHEATPESLLWDRPLERLETAFEAAGREFEVLEKRRVKSHSAGVEHVVVDVRVL